MLSFSQVAEALTGLIYHRPSGENFSSTLCLTMGEVSPETSPKNTMIQDMINSETILISMVELGINQTVRKLLSKAVDEV